MSPGGGTSGLGDINPGDIINVPRWGGHVLCVDCQLVVCAAFCGCYMQFFGVCYVHDFSMVLRPICYRLCYVIFYGLCSVRLFSLCDVHIFACVM